MDAYDCKALACVPSLPIVFSVAPRLYSIFISPCRKKWTMTGRMDDQTDGRMDDRTDG